MSQVTLPLTLFQTPDGNPVSFGSLNIRLSANGNASNTQINKAFTVIPLNVNGVIGSSPLFWTNASILPAGTYYILEVYSQTGQLVYGPSKLII